MIETILILLYFRFLAGIVVADITYAISSYKQRQRELDAILADIVATY